MHQDMTQPNRKRTKSRSKTHVGVKDSKCSKTMTILGKMHRRLT